MRLPFFIAGRYFFSRNNLSAINVITAISLTAYAVGAFALISLLSALNGFETSIFKVYENYYPDLKVTAVKGKTFLPDTELIQAIQSRKEIAAMSFVLEDNAVISNGENQAVGLIKGVDSNYNSVITADSLLVAGGGNFTNSGNQTWLAEGLFYRLNLGSEAKIVEVMAPSREGSGVSQMDMVQDELVVTGVIRPGDEVDQKLVVTGLKRVQELFERDGDISALEIRLKPGYQPQKVADELGKIIGPAFAVKDRRMQNMAVYKMFNTEKWVAFAILSFVLLIISFNLVGSLTMLVMDKKKDISVLKAIGAPYVLIRRIFFNEGLLISMSGTLVGLVAGISMVWLQSKYGFIQTHATFTAAYPVELRWWDVVLVFGLCFAVGISVSLYPALKSANRD